MIEKPVYLDYNATTPVDRQVFKVMLPYLKEQFGNPSSSHSLGVLSRKAVEHARDQVAATINASPDEIIFTAGATESNNLAIKGAAFLLENRKGHIITSAIEHPAVLEVCRWLEKQGYTVTFLPVDKKGLISPDDVKRHIREDTFLVSVMLANNETGVIQPVSEIAAICRSREILMHTDAAQAVGKIPVNVHELNCDMLSIAGHKMYAPKGIGALFIRKGVKISNIIHGANHEMGLRPGTENVPYIVGLGEAANLVAKNLDKFAYQMRKTRDYLFNQLDREIPDIKINGDFSCSLPNTANICFTGIDANTLLSEIGHRVAASAGAACHTDSVEPSHVLKAMGVSLQDALSSVRFSTGRNTTIEEIKKAVAVIIDSVHKMKKDKTPVFISTEDTSKIRLTRFTHGMGCACKIRPENLEQILKNIPLPMDKNVLVDTSTSDDAAVYRIDSKMVLIQTVDFFTPVVDDPYHFGRIAAVNSLSDIYAMGGKPLFALNLVGFPEERLPLTVLEEILKGAVSVADETGISILGGHTIDNTEPIFGWAATGIASENDLMRNNTPNSGDLLVLTKPIGTGIYSSALKKGLISSAEMSEAIDVMERLNALPSELAVKYNANAMTDVTGFGLPGHLREMLAGKYGAELYFSNLPFLDNLESLIRQGAVPGGTQANLNQANGFTEWSGSISPNQRLMICDAQTSGGLLISIPPDRADLFLMGLKEYPEHKAWIIGKVTEKPGIKVL